MLLQSRYFKCLLMHLSTIITFPVKHQLLVYMQLINY